MPTIGQVTLQAQQEARSELTTGTVTFMFTDIEASTRLEPLTR